MISTNLLRSLHLKDSIFYYPMYSTSKKTHVMLFSKAERLLGSVLQNFVQQVVFWFPNPQILFNLNYIIQNGHILFLIRMNLRGV